MPYRFFRIFRINKAGHCHLFAFGIILSEKTFEAKTKKYTVESFEIQKYNTLFEYKII